MQIAERGGVIVTLLSLEDYQRGWRAAFYVRFYHVLSGGEIPLLHLNARDDRGRLYPAHLGNWDKAGRAPRYEFWQTWTCHCALSASVRELQFEIPRIDKVQMKYDPNMVQITDSEVGPWRFIVPIPPRHAAGADGA